MSGTIALFASHKCVHPDCQPIKVGKSVIWIRVKEMGNMDLLDALDVQEECLEHEMLLNTIYKKVTLG